MYGNEVNKGEKEGTLSSTFSCSFPTNLNVRSVWLPAQETQISCNYNPIQDCRQNIQKAKDRMTLMQ